MSTRLTAIVLGVLLTLASVQAEDGAKITHSFLATGGETYLQDGDGKVLWSYPKSTRDGWVLPNGNLLLAVSKSNDGGSVVEVTREGKTVFEFQTGAALRQGVPVGLATCHAKIDIVVIDNFG